MGIQDWVLIGNAVTGFFYTDGTNIITPAVYEGYYPPISAQPDEPHDPDIGDYWLDTTP